MGKTKPRVQRMILLVVVVVGAVVVSFQGTVPSVMAPLAKPLVTAGTEISQRVFWWRESRVISSKTLAELYASRDELVLKLADFEWYKRENEELRAMLEFKERVPLASVAADILSKSLSHSTSRVVIDAGSDQGIRLGAPVIVGDGIFLGTVTELAKRSSTVTTLADPLHTVAVSLLNEHNTIGLATGTIGGLLRVDFIPADEAVGENELVVTSGLEGSIPSGLLVGVVNTVWQETSAPFQTAVVEPMADVRRLSSVLILLTQTSP